MKIRIEYSWPVLTGTDGRTQTILRSFEVGSQVYFVSILSNVEKGTLVGLYDDGALRIMPFNGGVHASVDHKKTFNTPEEALMELDGLLVSDAEQKRRNAHTRFTNAKKAWGIS